MSETKSTTRKSSKVKLLEKLLEVRKAVGYLQKAKHKGAVQFSYVSSDQVVGAVREKMNELGLLLIPAVTGHELTQFTTKNGAPQFMTEVDVIMTWIDTSTGEEYSVPYYGQGVDNSEKGVGKAATYLEKYFILKFFNVPTADLDPDAFQEKTNPLSSEEKLAAVMGELSKAKDKDEITEIWKKNKGLQKDRDFIKAVKEKASSFDEKAETDGK